ncbi:MAG: diguanylate cyclase [Gammaproteobacteria bacterium]|nr:diguanylate cyclase [Gammaproteobacteria bacterium]MBU0785294.1 diguanylate cyclase [Gammaproteobacteria bacterium]MBU0815877.1 diguanylate cyclase [Gammaproteobacteria bacterium]MBU1787416.1 diguanylate cyclase [Gammaproteobacteria bacterium]
MKTLDSLKINGQLPSPKGVALAILEACRRESVTTADIAQIVQSDPAMSGRLIRQANAANSGGRAIASVFEAVNRLGLASVRQLALGFSLVDQYQNGACLGFDYQGFWSHSLVMALAMEKFGTLGHGGAAQEMFCCGLMARVGCLGLATAYPLEYTGILALPLASPALLNEERTRLKTDHCELTAALLVDWGLPHVFAEAILWHETPAETGFAEDSRLNKLARLIHLSKCIADLCLAPEAERSNRISELMRLGGGIGLNADDFGTLVDEIVGQWREWGSLLKVPSLSLPAFSDMVTAPKSNDAADPTSLRILLVEDDPTSLKMMTTLLGTTLGHTVFTATNGQEAMAMAVTQMPQIVVTDWRMPIMDGLELCRALRATDWGQTMYIIMLTAADTEEEVAQAFEAGVDDYVQKPVNLRALRARMRAAWHYVKLLDAWERDRAQLKQFAAELAISNRRLEHFALTDSLTDLPNRRAGLMALDKAWNAANRSGQPLSALVIDIDRFKQVNDNHGHAIGDIMLQQVAKAILNAARKGDSVCRLGGEEFLIVCGNSDPKSAFLAAERLRFLVKSLSFRVGTLDLHTSVSIGVATREPDMEDADALVHAADTALYGAKNAGRDRTCIVSKGELLFRMP